eukprot:CAMPEP_0175802322 /NCGR_PEP_ID=MMETSP0097-20121207/87981_1 /TAXON_ID=311494 /ORGANISM="Alexandrium monilatum, Strain CCMP3105" /LENGTH=250 /DNA_ID=CAMNT_0017113655 /DNA_START=124 /DNA_END=873 /DNA_ORIENTATION=+
MVLKKARFSFWRRFFSPGSQRWQNWQSLPIEHPLELTKAQGLQRPAKCPADPALGSPAAASAPAGMVPAAGASGCSGPPRVLAQPATCSGLTGHDHPSCGGGSWHDAVQPREGCLEVQDHDVALGLPRGACDCSGGVGSAALGSGVLVSALSPHWERSGRLRFDIRLCGSHDRLPPGADEVVEAAAPRDLLRPARIRDAARRAGLHEALLQELLQRGRTSLHAVKEGVPDEEGRRVNELSVHLWRSDGAP